MPKVFSALLSGFDLILTWWRRLNGSPRLMSHWYVDLPGWRHAHHQALATQEYHLANDLHTPVVEVNWDLSRFRSQFAKMCFSGVKRCKLHLRRSYKNKSLTILLASIWLYTTDLNGISCFTPQSYIYPVSIQQTIYFCSLFCPFAVLQRDPS